MDILEIILKFLADGTLFGLTRGDNSAEIREKLRGKPDLIESDTHDGIKTIHLEEYIIEILMYEDEIYSIKIQDFEIEKFQNICGNLNGLFRWVEEFDLDWRFNRRNCYEKYLDIVLSNGVSVIVQIESTAVVSIKSLYKCFMD